MNASRHSRLRRFLPLRFRYYAQSQDRLCGMTRSPGGDVTPHAVSGRVHPRPIRRSLFVSTRGPMTHANTSSAEEVGRFAPTREAAATTLDEAAVRALRDGLRGELVRPGDAAYGEARVVWNALIDRR